MHNTATKLTLHAAKLPSWFRALFLLSQSRLEQQQCF